MADADQRCSESSVRIIRTTNLFLAFFGMGLCGVTGPTLIDLQVNVGTDTEQIAYIYVSKAIGAVAGSILGGIIFDLFNRQILFASLLFITALVTFTIPWWTNIILLGASMFISGLSLGAVDAGGNVWCLDLWGAKSGPFMQALHFTFGFGSFVAPFIAEPFLSPYTGSPQSDHTNETLNSTAISPSLDGYYTINTYAIISGFLFLVTVAFTGVLIIRPKDVPRHTMNVDRENETRPIYKISFLISTILFLAFFCGVEISYGQLLATYSVKSDLHLTKSKGSFITAAYWGAYTAGRFIGIFWATKVSAFSMLVTDLVIINVACVALVCFGNSYEIALWLGSALLGLGVASMYGSLFTWTERYVRVSSKIASVFVVSGALGEMVFPILVGHFMDSNPPFMLYMSLGFCLTCLLIFAFMWKISLLITDKYKEDDVVKRTEKVVMEEVPLNNTTDENDARGNRSS